MMVVMGSLYFAVSLIIFLLLPATGCNGVLLHLLTKTNLNTVPNKYIASVVKCNLMAGVLVLIAMLIALLSESIAQNSMFCFGMNFADRSLVAVAAWSLAGLSVERCHWNIYGNNNNQVASETRRYLTIIWIACFAYGLCCSTIQQSSVGFDGVEGICILPHHNRVTDIVIFTVDIVALFLVPTIIIIRCYCKIFKAVWCTPAANLMQQKKKKRSTLMNIAIVICDMLLWAPFCGFKIIVLIFYPDMVAEEEEKIQFAALCMDCLRFLVIPVVHFGFSEQARSEFRRIILRNNQVEQDNRTRRVTLAMNSNDNAPSVVSLNGVINASNGTLDKVSDTDIRNQS